MKENQVFVESICDCTVVIDLPEYHLRREWPRRGAKFPFEREVLESAFYDQSVETLFRCGFLKCDDKEFMSNVGLLDENDEPIVLELTDALMARAIKVMPINELKELLMKLTPEQCLELGDYVLAHYTDLKMDRVDLLSKACNKNLLKAIEFVKADKEE